MNAPAPSPARSTRPIFRISRAVLFLTAGAAFSVADATAAIIHNFLPPAVEFVGSSAPATDLEIAYRVDVPAGTPLTATRIEFAFTGSANAGEIVGRIYSHNTETNLPGEVLATGSNALPFTGEGTHVAVMDLPAPFVLQPGSTYWVAGTGATMAANFALGRLSSGMYPPSARRGVTTGSSEWQSGSPTMQSFPFRFGSPDPFPQKGSDFPPIENVTYASLFSPTSSDSDIVAFRAKIAGENITPATNTVIVKYGPDTSIVARTGQTAPGGVGSFQKFGDPVINSIGEVAFTGVLKHADGVTPRNDLAIWTTLDGSLHLALREGASAPGLTTSQHFRRVKWFHLSKDVLYLGAITSDGTVSRNGVWAWDGERLTKVIATGDAITLGDSSTTVKTFTKPAGGSTGNAQSRISSPGGRLTLFVTGANGAVEMVRF